MRKIILSASLFVLALFVAVGQTVTGFVYEDANRNGKKDAGEKGIASVAVSNGTEVVPTDAQGAYRLPLSNDNIIFVIKPTGYQIALDSFNLPRSYYIYKPDGSPSALRYKGVAPTGKLPSAVNFGLTPYDEPDKFTAFVFGDPQIYNESDAEFLLNGIVEETRQNTDGVSFGITLGDLVGDALNLHPVYKAAIRKIGLPWYNVMGNHDMNYDGGEDRFGDETFEANFGPSQYAFNYGKAHFIVLDDIIRPNPTTGRDYSGGLRTDQFDFLQNDLACVPHDRLIVIAMHIPLLEKGMEAEYDQDDLQHFFRLLKDYPNVLFLSAHTHTLYQNFFGREQKVNRDKPIHEYNAGATCGDWYSGMKNEKGLPSATMCDGTPQNYSYLHVDGNSYVLDYKALGKPSDYQMNIYNAKVVAASHYHAPKLTVNFFMGTAHDTVEYRLNGGEWLRLKWEEGTDPTYVRYVQDFDFSDEVPSGRRPSEPGICHHLWTTRLPHRLAVGTYAIEVRATDTFGRQHTGHSSIRIQ